MATHSVLTDPVPGSAIGKVHDRNLSDGIAVLVFVTDDGFGEIVMMLSEAHGPRPQADLWCGRAVSGYDAC